MIEVEQHRQDILYHVQNLVLSGALFRVRLISATKFILRQLRPSKVDLRQHLGKS